MRYLLIVLLLLCTSVATADVLSGRVVDSESGEPLEGVRIMCLMTSPDGLGGTYKRFATNVDGKFLTVVSSMSKVTLNINYLGYETFSKELICSGGTNDTINLGDLKMKMTDVLMKELMVDAKVRRFYLKGDTVVFNPDAFNLEEGARMAELLTKLPGVSIKGGKVYYLNNEVHLKMNGHDVSDGNLTTMLPAEAVQNVKAYQKKSETSELSGMDDGQEQQVLDITIKPGFMDKWYGQVKASAYASKNYRGSANLHYLSDYDPLNLYVRASDNATKVANVFGTNDSDMHVDYPTRQQYGKFTYRHNWKPKYVKTSYEDYWQISFSPDHNDIKTRTWLTTETFLDGALPTFYDSETSAINSQLHVPLSLETELHLGPTTTMALSVEGKYGYSNSNSNLQQDTYEGNISKIAVNSFTNESFSSSKNVHMKSRISLTHNWKKTSLNAYAGVLYENSTSNGKILSEYDYILLGTHETTKQTSTANNYRLNTWAGSIFGYQIIPKMLKLNAGYTFRYNNTDSRSDNLLNGQFDYVNSYIQKTRSITNSPNISLETDLGDLWMKVGISMVNSDEEMNYQRGNLDTLAYRNNWMPHPEFAFKWKISKLTELKGNTSFNRTLPSLLDCIDYFDDTNPMNIVMGNSKLSATNSLNALLQYNIMFTKGQQMLNMTTGYTRNVSPIREALFYNSKSGSYISTKVNVDSYNKWSIGANYDRSLGEYFRLVNSIGADIICNHGVKTRTHIDSPLEQYSQNSLILKNNTKVIFQHKGWEVSAFGSFDYNRLRFSVESYNDHNLWNYNAGFSGEYRLKTWTFNISGRLFGNSGYDTDYMNRDRFSLDASVTWKTLKNKGLITLSARDILNQMDKTIFSITPNSHTEGYSETFHRYLALTFTYNFDAKSSKNMTN